MEYSKTLIEFLRIWIMCAGYTLSDIKGNTVSDKSILSTKYFTFSF